MCANVYKCILDIECLGIQSNINDKKHQDSPDYKAKMRAHERKFDKMWSNFNVLAGFVCQEGGTVAIEWPTSCSYWNKHRVKDFIQFYGLKKVNFHAWLLCWSKDAAAVGGLFQPRRR